jgi:gluconate 5-dehydrogenase
MALNEVKNVLPVDKNIVITGGYGHLGKAISLSLSHHGARVFVAARSKEKFLEAFLDDLEKDRIQFLQMDISSTNSIQSAFEKLGNEGIQIDGLINNAFYAKGQSPTEMSKEDFTYTLEGTLTSVFEVMKQALPHLSEGTSIVNVSSMYGMVAPDFKAYEKAPEYLNPPHYGAAKAGVIQLSKYYASFLGSKRIRVNTVTPGPFPSDAVQENKEFLKALEERTLLGRIGKPEDLAGIFCFLMSEASSFVTGQNFVVDGGWTVR